MEKVKASLRLMVMVVLLILAAFGVGITGVFMNNNKEQYMDKEIRIERVDKKKDDESEDETKN